MVVVCASMSACSWAKSVATGPPETGPMPCEVRAGENSGAPSSVEGTNSGAVGPKQISDGEGSSSSSRKWRIPPPLSQCTRGLLISRASGGASSSRSAPSGEAPPSAGGRVSEARSVSAQSSPQCSGRSSGSAQQGGAAGPAAAGGSSEYECLARLPALLISSSLCLVCSEMRPAAKAAREASLPECDERPVASSLALCMALALAIFMR
mmetsp:Transcript_14248/g.29890  ORF Transcript_14248/g.29890 Transcript_14248/m.29890 type:complete len:209 (-) Transcript_14248:376-1002(-)